MENKRHHSVVVANQLRQRAFTLIEILIVIALSVLLFGLLLKPLISSLQYTKEAQALAAAQDSSRKVVEMMNRELGSAAYVFDNRSHPFQYDPSTATSGSDLYTNFLNLEIPTETNGRTIAHCYDAKLDIVMARRKTGNTTLLDPTDAGQPITLGRTSGNESGVVTASEVQFPLAPGTSIVRYFIGLKNPTKTFSNLNEQRANTANDNNTYVLYRTQISLTIPDTTNPGQFIVDPKYFTNVAASKGETLAANPTTFAADKLTPELDDPDFFRYVTDADIDWLSPNHDTYGTTGNMGSHNARVDAWVQVAKPIVTAPDIDLLVLPRNADGDIDYDTNAPFVGVPHFGFSTDAITSVKWPTIRSSMIFRSASITSEAVPSTTSDYSSLGLPANAADTGLSYIPAVYTSTSKSWSIPYTIRLYPNGAYAPLTDKLITIQSTNTDGNLTSLTANDSPGDIIEYLYDPAVGPNFQPVYNVTKGIPEVAYSTTTPVAQDFVPLIVDPDKGVISFDIGPNPSISTTVDGPLSWPPLKSNQTVPYKNSPPSSWPTTAQVDANTFWYFSPVDVGQTTPAYGVGGNMIDLTLLTDKAYVLRSPLKLIKNAILVPGSVRVYGPDNTPGPNYGAAVMYTPVTPSVTPAGNQYKVDYATGILTFAPGLPTTQVSGGTTVEADPVQVTFHYQANLSGTPPYSLANQAHPLRVAVDYQTRDLLEINVGIRVYRPGTASAQIINATNTVTVGNSNQ